MPHILISYKDNVSFSLYTTKLSREGGKRLGNKNWIGFNAEGVEKYYTNSPGVNHILIQNCSQEEFNEGVTDYPIQYRVVNDDELTEKTGLLFDSCKLRLNVNAVLSKDMYVLKAASKVDNKEDNKEKIKQSASTKVSISVGNLKEQQAPTVEPEQMKASQSGTKPAVSMATSPLVLMGVSTLTVATEAVTVEQDDLKKTLNLLKR